ncbi:WXG100 family type VII secretion target [Nocardia terpenica]|uniref:WXG100 family type VII secretion target n=1 Tax=Nocardia terpenica TaxID=455432 RepID=A0A6G9Z295_9NOCA|nr:WXG100 family type VII secretion target [Nocardia terpenica]QIS19550.1 hypothetical protein F6W96_15925 [Nocardia terpenica]
MSDDTSPPDIGGSEAGSRFRTVRLELFEVDGAGREVMTVATAVRKQLVQAETMVSALVAEWREPAAADFESEWDAIYRHGLACVQGLHTLGELLRSVAGAFDEADAEAAAALRGTSRRTPDPDLSENPQ